MLSLNIFRSNNKVALQDVSKIKIMKTLTTLRSIAFKIILSSSVLLFTFCDSKEELVFDSSKNLLTKDAAVVELLTKMATKNIAAKTALKNSSTTPECTGLSFPISFNAYFGDDPNAQEIVVNNDEELLQFFSTTLTAENPYYVVFPVTLLDAEGTETEVHSLEELESIIHLALDICYNDDDTDDENDDENDDDQTDQDDSDDGYQYCDSNKKKVYICHKGKTICVSVNAIWGHLEHHKEDFLGKCD